MRILVRLFISTIVMVGVFAAPSKTYICKSQNFRVTLPAAFTAELGTFAPADYNSSDFFQKDLKLPAIRKDARDSNALAIHGPGGTYAVIFGFNSAFLNVDQISARVFDYARSFAENNGTSTDDLIRTETTTSMLGALSASEISIRRSFGDTDSVFTEIIVAPAGKRTFGLIMRAHESMLPRVTSMSRQLLSSILSTLSIDAAFEEPTLYNYPRFHFQLSAPQYWTSVLYKKGPNIMSEVPLSSGKPDSINSLWTSHPDSAWNTLIFQLPLFQLEIIHHEVKNLDSSEQRVAQAASFVRLTPPERIDPIINDGVTFAGVKGSELSYSLSKRGSIIRYKIIAAHKNGVQLVARITAWQHDIPLIEATINRVLSTLSFQ